MSNALICKCCGGRINPAKMICEYCGTHYKSDLLHEIVIESANPHVRVVGEKVRVDMMTYRELGEELACECVRRQIAGGLVEDIMKMIDLEYDYDILNNEMVFRGTARLVDSEYKF